MPKRTSEEKTPSDFEDLRSTLKQLCQWVEALTDSVDRIVDELQWRNNERRGENGFPPPPVTLRSMPADPNADNWALNRVPAEQVTALRDQLDGQPAASPPVPASHAHLCREIADLRQIAAMIVLLMSDHDLDDVSMMWESLLAWALQEFDSDILREALPAAVTAEDEPTPVESAFPNRSSQQPTLFPDGTPAADPSVQPAAPC
jgi:hypothetical protein